MRSKNISRDLLVLIAYLFFSLLVYYPLLPHFGSRIFFTNGDAPNFAWNLWWFKYALTELGTNPLFCGYMFHPLGASLVFNTNSFLNSLFYLLLGFFISIETTLNLLIIILSLASCYFSYLLCKQLCTSRWGAFMGGLIYGLSSFIQSTARGHYNLLHLCWLPLFILFLHSFVAYKKPKYIFYAMITFAIDFYSSHNYFIIMITYALIYSLHDCKKLLKKETIVAFFKGMLPGAILLVIMLLPTLHQLHKQSAMSFHYHAGGSMEEAILYSNDLLDFLRPWNHQKWLNRQVWMPFLELIDTKPMGARPGIYLGVFPIMSLILSVIMLRGNSKARYWRVILLIFFILSLGPVLKVNNTHLFSLGEHKLFLPLPYMLYYHIPLLGDFRCPSRFIVMVFLAIAVLASMVISRIQERVVSGNGRRAKSALFAVVMLLVSYFHLADIDDHQNAVTSIRPPRFISALGELGGEGAVLTIPFTVRDGHRGIGLTQPLKDALLIYDQAFHEHRMPSGFSARLPEEHFDYFESIPFLRTLAELQVKDNTPDINMSIISDAAQKMAEFMGLEYVIVNHRFLQNAGLVFNLLEKTYPDARVIYIDEDYLVTRLNYSSMKYPLEISGDADLRKLFLVHKNHQPIRIGIGGRVHEAIIVSDLLSIILPDTKWQEVSLEIHLKTISILEPPNMMVKVNGRNHDKIELEPGTNSIDITVPARLCTRANNLLQMFIEQAAARHDIQVVSAGMNSGNYSVIAIDGTDYSPNKRGYNIILFDPANLRVLDSYSFDIYMDAAEADRMLQTLRTAPPGILILGAIKDEATMNLSAELCEFMVEMGSAMPHKDLFRSSHAFIACNDPENNWIIEDGGYGVRSARFSTASVVIESITVRRSNQNQ